MDYQFGECDCARHQAMRDKNKPLPKIFPDFEAFDKAEKDLSDRVTLWFTNEVFG